MLVKNKETIFRVGVSYNTDPSLYISIRVNMPYNVSRED